MNFYFLIFKEISAFHLLVQFFKISCVIQKRKYSILKIKISPKGIPWKIFVFKPRLKCFCKFSNKFRNFFHISPNACILTHKFKNNIINSFNFYFSSKNASTKLFSWIFFKFLLKKFPFVFNFFFHNFSSFNFIIHYIIIFRFLYQIIQGKNLLIHFRREIQFLY